MLNAEVEESEREAKESRNSVREINEPCIINILITKM
jgi:hypothetical protein